MDALLLLIALAAPTTLESRDRAEIMAWHDTSSYWRHGTTFADSWRSLEDDDGEEELERVYQVLWWDACCHRTGWWTHVFRGPSWRTCTHVRWFP